jgi:hypothetical protein
MIKTRTRKYLEGKKINVEKNTAIFFRGEKKVFRWKETEQIFLTGKLKYLADRNK